MHASADAPAPRRYLVAPDKFKGTLTGAQAAAAITRGVHRADPSARVRELPFADGGEGTVDAMIHAGAQRIVGVVAGPLGTPVTASWALRDGAAVIELAEASGLRHVVPTPATALAADTTGTGQLIAAALDRGITEVVIGLGGSASTDGGFGALRALGVRFLTAQGEPVTRTTEIPAITRIDTTGLHPGLATATIDLCADVRSPLTGPRGAAAVFAPQKGADAGTVAILGDRLAHLARHYAPMAPGRDVLGAGGAAGGFAAGAMAVLGARLRGGGEVLAEVLGLAEAIGESDVVIVGEGSLDEQSRFGKTPVGIARIARSLGVPTIAVVGVTTLGPDALLEEGISTIVSAAEMAPTPAAARARASTYVERAAAAAVAALG
ncbi:MAG: glycerate kinase [Propioniciclava sp.]